MVDKVNMSLDEIIKQTPKARGGGAGRKFGGRGRGRGRGPPRVAGGVGGGDRTRQTFSNLRNQFNRAGGDIEGRWQHDLYDGPVRRTPSAMGSGSSKLIVQNLDFGVSDADVTELFSEFGPLKVASIHYDRSGRSLGVADVIFERRVDAVRALKEYNNVPLDGRPMKIKFADEALSPGIRNSGRIQRPMSRGRGGVGRGRGRGGRFGAKKGLTVEELDAELDAWKISQ